MAIRLRAERVHTMIGPTDEHPFLSQQLHGSERLYACEKKIV